MLLAALGNYILFKALNLELSMLAAIFLLLALQVASVPPALPGKIGIYEYTVILSLAVLGIDRNVALGYGLLLHIVAFAPKLVLGALFIGDIEWRRAPARGDEREGELQ
jgi:uncharacterized protein (TIRG00374 family)